MTLSPLVRTRLFAVGAAAVAVWLGFAIAEGNYGWPGLIATALGLLILARWQPRPLSTVLIGVVIIGYVIGSRGFAQLSFSSRFPLLPAEAVLLVAGSLLLVQAAWRHELPFQRDPLHLLLLAWMVYGTIRVVFDARIYGFMALRDFATVYYAGFFFLAQEAARDPRSSRYLQAALLGSCAVLLPLHLLFERFPGFFLNTLTLRGNPVIYYKGDLVGTFLAVGAVLCFLRFEKGRSAWNAIASLAFVGAVLATNNRASMLGLAVATGWLAIAGRWRFAVFQAVTGTVAVVVILTAALVMRVSWEKTPVFGVYERIVSIADPMGQRTYRGGETFNKGDNNLYRAVWWQSVIDETVEGNPYLGLGFGRDLADRFLRQYYPDVEEFSVRSPHNILLSIFARMGAVGLALFLAALGVIAVRTWRAARDGPAEAAPWCAAWVIFTSACFGVVLEGPMGAVVFWTVLGVANGTRSEKDPSPAEADALAHTIEPAPAVT